MEFNLFDSCLQIKMHPVSYLQDNTQKWLKARVDIIIKSDVILRSLYLNSSLRKNPGFKDVTTYLSLLIFF